MGFDFKVEYNPGCLNRGADALSRRDLLEPQLHAISQPQVLLLDSIQDDIQNHPELLDLYRKIEQGTVDHHWEIQDGLKRMVDDYVSVCQVFQRNKADSLHPVGLLQPFQLLSQGTKLVFSSAYHPQSNEQTEVVNHTLEIYLRCFVGDHPKRWVHWPWAMLAQVKSNLQKAQAMMKHNYDKSHRDLSFVPGDYVWLRLQPYRHCSLSATQRHIISPKFYGPFQVLARIGKVAYRLQLPPNAHIHDVCHVSLLKPFHGDSPMLHIPLPPLHEGRGLPSPAQVLQARRVHGSWELLVQWADAEAFTASWALYSTFEPEDMLFLQEGVML
ncbi:uncharacterized protein [Aristolochia californica]|uniref:uncharacterized protein n=1 Tax=Aristolochia californica TaxID=171875 RepID=UPI0035D9C3F0